jgi:hypothetical protein
MGFILGLVVGAVVTGVLFIVFGKNNKKKIEAARSEIVNAYNKGASEVEKLVKSWTK